MKEWLLESGNKVGTAHFETSRFLWHAQNEQQRSFSVCYTSVFCAKFYCFTNGTPYLLRVQILTLFRGSPYLVLRGVRLTVLGQNIEKYERSENLSGRPPTAKIITLLITYRQVHHRNQKHWKSNFLLLKLWKDRNFETFRNLCLVKLWNFFILGNSQKSEGRRLF